MVENHEGSDRQKRQNSSAGDTNSERSCGTPVSLNSEAIAHLRVAWEQFAEHVNLLVQSEDPNAHQPVIDDLKRIRNTLVVLEKTASQFVIEELIAVFHQDDTHNSNVGELTRVLLNAVHYLDKHIYQMQKDVDADNALSLVVLVNDCRAYRDEMLLTDALMLAAGIEFPDVPSVSVSETTWSEQRELWVDYASSIHVSLVQRLLHWWRSERSGSAGPLIRQLDRMAAFSDEHDYLNCLAPLFQSASLVANGVKDGQIDEGPALRSLYAQLERNVHRCALVAVPDDLVPDDLLRNFLYYAAQIESDIPAAINLRRRFRLDRVRQIAQSVRLNDTPTIGVEYHLTNAIRDGVIRESDYLREWLDAPESPVVRAKLARVKVRLGQLDPVLTIMSATEPLTCLKSINQQLDDFENSVADEATRDRLSQSLLMLDTLLDQSARQSILKVRSAKAVELSAHDVYVDTATDACLREARREIQALTNQLLSSVDSSGLAKQVSRKLSVQLNKVNSALQVLPLPELGPLFESLDLVIQKLSNYNENTPLSDPESVQSMFACVLASIDDYLGCVLSPQSETDLFLTDASETLETIIGVLDINSASSSEVAVEKLPPQLVERLLDIFATVGESIADYKSQANENTLLHLGRVLTELRQLANNDAIPGELNRLASTAGVWFEQILSDDNAVLSADNLCTLEEVQGLFPILLNSSNNEFNPTIETDELLQKLEREAMDAPDDVFSEPEPLLDDLLLSDIGSLTLNVDDDLLLESISDEESSSLDETLQLVFQHECLGHLESLDESVKLAQNSRDVSEARLPNEKMLRALHTLTGSAQTINATDVVAIVLPLQRASLSLHREGRHFDATQTHFIGELVVALRSRLDAINSGESLTDDGRKIEEKLDGFLSETVPGLAESGQDSAVSLSIGSHVKSLEDVFSDESAEILEKLRRLIRQTPFDHESLNAAQNLLHTLKGTARMVGKLSISECAHQIESDLQSADSAQLQLDALKAGYRSLHSLLLQSSARRMVNPPAELQVANGASYTSVRQGDHDFGVDAGALLEMATDLAVNQVRLSDELMRMRNVCKDIDSTSFRWRKLLEQTDLSESPASTEILADMEAVCLEMRSAIRQAERDQQQASRVSANLQQSLVRSRLCRLDGISERLDDTIADLAGACGVAARFELSGGEIMVDRELYRQLAAPLEHLVRNSVVHGIEPAEQRLASEKPSTGRISLAASVEGSTLVLRFGDDGRGVNRKAFDQMLTARGEQSVNTEEQLLSLLLKPGFSTVDKANSIAGHGLGLSAVKTAVEQMGGQLQLQMSEEAGIQVTMRIPQPMVVKQVVLVKDGDRYYGIPVVHVKSVQFSDSELTVGSDPDASALPKVSIQGLLGTPDRLTHKIGQTSLVSVSEQGQSLQIEVEEIVGYRELVTQPLGAQIESLERFSDGSVLPAGQRVLVLDIPALLGSEPANRPQTQHSDMPLPQPVAALIVDDSPTARNQTSDSLRQWGIAVSSSRDGLDAMETMTTGMPDIVIVDLEMPRLDGFGLLQKIAKQNLNKRPAIIVLSHKDNQQHREMATQLGAVRFLVKPYSESELHEAVEAAGLRLPDLTIA